MCRRCVPPILKHELLRHYYKPSGHICSHACRSQSGTHSNSPSDCTVHLSSDTLYDRHYFRTDHNWAPITSIQPASVVQIISITQKACNNSTLSWSFNIHTAPHVQTDMGLPTKRSTPQPYEDYSQVLNFVIWVLAGYATIFIFLRLWGKYYRGRRLWWDDYLLISSWLALILGCIFQTVDTTLGFGRSQHAIPLENIENSRLLATIAGFFLILAAAWSKTSFGLTLVRLTRTDGFLKRLVWFAIWTTNIFIAGSCIIQWAHCWPLDRIWRQEVSGGKCLPLGLMNGYNMFVAGKLLHFAIR